MKNRPRCYHRLQQLLILIFLTSFTHLNVTSKPSHPKNLVVGLYPYVPRIEQFETAIADAWNALHPNIHLQFLTEDTWDGGYDLTPPSQADVFVFDALYLNYFRQLGTLEIIKPEEINNLDDILPYARKGVKTKEGYLGIPLLGCANMMFYYKKDTEIDQADRIEDLNTALGQCTYTSKVPPDRRGLMIDMAGGTTNATLYLSIQSDITGQWPVIFPQSEKDLDPKTIAIQRKMLAMASYQNGTEDFSSDYGRAEWFSRGYGRVTVGYTEAMSHMSQATRESTHFRLFPLSNSEQNIDLFFSDIAAVNTTTVLRGTRALAIELANLITSTNTVVASIGADDTHPYPQYLMPTRVNVFDALSDEFPKYKDMRNIVSLANPVLFSLDTNARDWIDKMKSVIKDTARENYLCGCDYIANSSIQSNKDAKAICDSTCSDHGGWSGAWTNQSLATPSKSVCGCMECSTP